MKKIDKWNAKISDNGCEKCKKKDGIRCDGFGGILYCENCDIKIENPRQENAKEYDSAFVYIPPLPPANS